MQDRLTARILYIGSAAIAALLAACLSSPEIGSLSCHTSGANGTQRCELAAPVESVPAPADGVSGTSPKK